MYRRILGFFGVLAAIASLALIAPATANAQSALPTDKVTGLLNCILGSAGGLSNEVQPSGVSKLLGCLNERG